ncbi:MAG TPA: hypothetical protein VF783_14200 [Terriglobales bacterium]
MAIGDSSDIFSRLKAALPLRWFGSTADSMPVVDSLLTGISTALSFIYSLYAYAKNQTRLATATDGWLDVAAYDFFGTSVVRTFGQTDAAFRNVILANLFRARGTRQSVIDVLTQLTGHAPAIFEPARPADTGAYDLGGVGYDLCGGYGDILVAQAFITAYRPQGAGIPLIAGYDISAWAYDTGSQAEYISSDMYAGSAPDSAIYAAINSVRPAGVTLWVRIQNWPPVAPVLPSYYPPAFALAPPPDNAVITSDGSYVVDSGKDYIVHS